MPTDKARLQIGDIITAIDGRPVRDVRADKNRIGLVRFGKRLQLTIMRHKKRIDVLVTVEALNSVHLVHTGLEFTEEISRNGRRYIRLDSVLTNSIHARYGFRLGDAALSVNRQAVSPVQ